MSAQMLVFVAYVTCECSGEPTHPRSLARAFVAGTIRVGMYVRAGVNCLGS